MLSGVACEACLKENAPALGAACKFMCMYVYF